MFSWTANETRADLRSPATAVNVDRVDVVPWTVMDADHRRRWHQIRRQDPAFESPFFSTQFVDAVQQSRGDVDVAVLYAGAETVGYWPMHRIDRVAKPVGRFLNDAHNVLASDRVRLDWRMLLRAAEVRGFDFHALTGSTRHIESCMIDGYEQSFAADLSDGGERFVARIETEHRTMRKQNQKTRKLQREIGPLRFEMDCQDHGVLDAAIEWKRHQYQRTHILDLFTPDWTRNMVHHLHALDSEEECRGMLSVLWAGDQAVAAHIGMRQGRLLHYWFPVYDPAFAKYSPGTLLFKTIASESDRYGINKIDMGYGAQPYKRKQTDVITTVARGCITECPITRLTRTMKRYASDIKSQVPLKETVKRVVRAVYPNAGIGKLR